jgi:hypothetical protein
MINNKQFRELIVRPGLTEIDLYCKDSEELLVAVMAKESLGGTYLAQLGGGPALGFFQEEISTFVDLWNRFLMNKKPDLLRKIMVACNFASAPGPKELVNNIKFSMIMARVKFLTVEDPLPPYDNIEAIAEYWKKIYNSSGGKGTIQEFIQAYHNFNK